MTAPVAASMAAHLETSVRSHMQYKCSVVVGGSVGCCYYILRGSHASTFTPESFALLFSFLVARAARNVITRTSTIVPLVAIFAS
jgi:hypothetical protein